MKLLLIRHGATPWNRENRVLGRTDMPLNEEGALQARAEAEALKDVDIARIYTSPMKRAYKTAEIIGQYHDCSIYIEDRLIEMNFGTFEGFSRDDESYKKAKSQYFMRYPGGESFQDVSARIYGFLDELKEKHQDETVAVVTHNGICRVVATYFGDLTNEEFANFQMKNCECRVFE